MFLFLREFRVFLFCKREQVNWHPDVHFHRKIKTFLHEIRPQSLSELRNKQQRGRKKNTPSGRFSPFIQSASQTPPPPSSGLCPGAAPVLSSSVRPAASSQTPPALLPRLPRSVPRSSAPRRSAASACYGCSGQTYGSLTCSDLQLWNKSTVNESLNHNYRILNVNFTAF